MKGFTLFYALLVSSLALSIGLAIFDLTERELELSSAGTQSQYAIYAADTGAECALYWDNHYSGPTSNSAFGTSSSYQGAATQSSLNCANIDITNTAVSGWAVSAVAGAATTTFTINFTNTTPAEPYCASVTVAKVGNPPATVITSNGFNTCTNNVFQLQRTLQVNY